MKSATYRSHKQGNKGINARNQSSKLYMYKSLYCRSHFVISHLVKIMINDLMCVEESTGEWLNGSPGQGGRKPLYTPVESKCVEYLSAAVGSA